MPPSSQKQVQSSELKLFQFMSAALQVGISILLKISLLMFFGSSFSKPYFCFYQYQVHCIYGTLSLSIKCGLFINSGGKNYHFVLYFKKLCSLFYGAVSISTSNIIMKVNVNVIQAL